MFIGEFAHTIDDKGRINLPAKFRRDIKEIVVTKGLDGCLFAYPQKEWQILAEKLAALPLTSQKSRAFARLMLAGAWHAEPDSQGRIMLPEYLRAYASLGKHAIIAGLYNRLEIWDEDAWNEYKARMEAQSEDIAEAMAELGI